jgi:hypothetical protein
VTLQDEKKEVAIHLFEAAVAAHDSALPATLQDQIWEAYLSVAEWLQLPTDTDQKQLTKFTKQSTGVEKSASRAERTCGPRSSDSVSRRSTEA